MKTREPTINVSGPNVERCFGRSLWVKSNVLERARSERDVWYEDRRTGFTLVSNTEKVVEIVLIQNTNR